MDRGLDVQSNGEGRRGLEGDGEVGKMVHGRGSPARTVRWGVGQGVIGLWVQVIVLG